jgi:hypothetical protein
MEEKILTIKDMMAGVTADMDQTQALLNEARDICIAPSFQAKLDEMQADLDVKRGRVEMFRIIDEMLG